MTLLLKTSTTRVLVTDWRHINDYVAALKLFNEVTTVAGADSYPTISAVVPVFFCSLTHLRSSTAPQFTSVFSDSTTKAQKDERFPDYKLHETASLKMFLDFCYNVLDKLSAMSGGGTTLLRVLECTATEAVALLSATLESCQFMHTVSFRCLTVLFQWCAWWLFVLCSCVSCVYSCERGHMQQ